MAEDPGPRLADHDAPDGAAPAEPLTPLPGARAAKDFFFGDVHRTAVTVGVLVLLVAVLTLIVALSQDQTSRPVVVSQPASTSGWTPPSAPSAIDSEAALSQYVLSRSLWTARPSVYGSSLTVALRQQVEANGRSHAEAISNGEPKAYSAGEFTAEGAHLAGRIVYVVGRLSFRAESPTRGGNWTPSALTDIELSSPVSDRHVYGVLAQPVGAHTGDVVFARAVVAGVGSGPVSHTVTYIVVLEGFNEARYVGRSRILKHLIGLFRGSRP
jgi:hypothetical protein